MFRKHLAVLLLLFPAPVVGQDDTRVVKPLIEVGDRWTYRGVNMLGPGAEEYDVQVASVHSDLIQLVCTRKRDGKEFDGIQTDELSAATTCSGFIQRPPPRFLRFPLIAGNSFSVKYTVHRARESKYAPTVEGTVVVKGWESVEVPAGRFRAMIVEAELAGLQQDGGTQRRVATYWYSPEVRRWVKFRSIAHSADTFEEELLSYKLAE